MFKPHKQFVKQNPNLNEGIRAHEVLVVLPDGKTQKMATPVALRQAKELGLDLILVSPNAFPPVAKIADNGAYIYEQKKKAKANKRNQHVQLTKELKFRPSTEEHDIGFKKEHAVRSLTEGHKVKIIVQFKGREIQHAALGTNLIRRLISELTPYGTPESEPRLEGKAASVLMAPI